MFLLSSFCIIYQLFIPKFWIWNPFFLYIMIKPKWSQIEFLPHSYLIDILIFIMLRISQYIIHFRPMRQAPTEAQILCFGVLPEYNSIIFRPWSIAKIKDAPSKSCFHLKIFRFMHHKPIRFALKVEILNGIVHIVN